MQPTLSNNNRKPLPNKRKSVDTSDVESKYIRSRQVAKLELNLKIKLENLLNNKLNKDDYFTIESSDYNSDSNSSISTICANSNKTRSRDYCCSDTDVTHADDIVILLDENSFYSAKINPFHQLNFPNDTTVGDAINNNENTNEIATNIIDVVHDVVDKSEKDTSPAFENSPAVNKDEAENLEDNYIINNIPLEVITEEREEEEEIVFKETWLDIPLEVNTTETEEDVVKKCSLESQYAVKLIDYILGAAVTEVEIQKTRAVCDSSTLDSTDDNLEAVNAEDNTIAIADYIPPEVNTTAEDEALVEKDSLEVIDIPLEVNTTDMEGDVHKKCSLESQYDVKLIDSVLGAPVTEVEMEKTQDVDNSSTGDILEVLNAEDNIIADIIPPEANTTAEDEAVVEKDSLEAIDNLEANNAPEAVNAEKEEEEVVSQSSVNIIDSELGAAVNEVEIEKTDAVSVENQPPAKAMEDVVVVEDDPSENENYGAANDPLPLQSTKEMKITDDEKEKDGSVTASSPAAVNATQDIAAIASPVRTFRQNADRSPMLFNKSYLHESSSDELENKMTHLLKRSNTRIASKTKVRITTDDVSMLDVLEDLPDFINTSISELTSSFISERMLRRGSTRKIRFDSNSSSRSTTGMKLMQSLSLSTPSTPSTLSVSSSYSFSSSSTLTYNYISSREAYMRLNKLLKHGTRENRKAVGYDEYYKIRVDDEIASSEEEFLSDLDDLDLTGWRPPESELRRQVGIILTKLNPLEHNYKDTIKDMLYKYLKYINDERRISKINGIIECVEQPLSHKEKTELLIKREVNDKRLNNKFYYAPDEPPGFSELAARRRVAIFRKYDKCRNDRIFCYNYFKRSIEYYNRPISKLEHKIEELKRQFKLIFA